MASVRDTAKVRFGRPIDDTKNRRKTPAPRSRRMLASSVEHIIVDERVMRAAKAARRPGEKLLIKSSVEVWLVPDRGAL